MLYVLQEDVLTYAVNGKFQSKLYTFPSTLPACDRADCAKVQEQQAVGSIKKRKVSTYKGAGKITQDNRGKKCDHNPSFLHMKRGITVTLLKDMSFSLVCLPAPIFHGTWSRTPPAP